MSRHERKRFVGASHDETFQALRMAARERGEALRAAELSAVRSACEPDDDDEDDTDDDIAAPSSPPPSVRGAMVARRLSALARMLGLPANATRMEIKAAIDALSRADVRAQMRHRLGELGR